MSTIYNKNSPDKWDWTRSCLVKYRISHWYPKWTGLSWNKECAKKHDILWAPYDGHRPPAELYTDQESPGTLGLADACNSVICNGRPGMRHSRQYTVVTGQSQLRDLFIVCVLSCRLWRALAVRRRRDGQWGAKSITNESRGFDLSKSHK